MVVVSRCTYTDTTPTLTPLPLHYYHHHRHHKGMGGHAVMYTGDRK